jgi:hypothetical protein
MLTAQRTAHAARRLAAGMATAVERIGDTKVPMSLLEKGAYINYQRIDDSLHVVRSRYAYAMQCDEWHVLIRGQSQPALDPLGENSLRPPRRPRKPGHHSRDELPQAPP